MQIQLVDGYITGYSTFGGGLSGCIEAPDDALDGINEAHLSCYRWTGTAAELDEDKLAAVTAAEAAAEIRTRREAECFPVINRGQAWYALLTPEQADGLAAWYQAWLDAPETGIVPEPLEWIK